jgi:release factor glutamine methyltransferase
VELLEHDLRHRLPGGPYDLVVSNPPYVRPDELGTLMPDVRDWEPHLALVGSGATEMVSQAARDVLAPEGWLVLEVGDGQAATTTALLAQLGYLDVRSTPDLTGRDRVVEGRRG